jgi:hypothetical protein
MQTGQAGAAGRRGDAIGYHLPGEQLAVFGDERPAQRADAAGQAALAASRSLGLALGGPTLGSARCEPDGGFGPKSLDFTPE